MKIIIQGELISLNEYIYKERSNRFAAADVKEEETNRVFWECKAQKIQPIQEPVFIEFHWFCKNTRKDKDNIVFARKFILDGLVKAHVLSSDKWDVVDGFSDNFCIDAKNPRIEVIIHDRHTSQRSTVSSDPSKRI